MMFLRHPAWLWLKKNDPKKLPPIDDATQAMFDAGNDFEQYAEKLFPAGIRIGFDSYDEYRTMPERTTKALDEGAKTIFQGRFVYGKLTFICDVIQVIKGTTVDLVEIKSSTRAKVDHEYDLAFQAVVLEGCGYTVRNISVIHVNNQYVRQGDIDAKELTASTDVTDAVKDKIEITKKHIEQAVETAELPRIPDISPSFARLGSFNDWLGIYRVLTEVKEYSIYDLVSVGAKNTGLLEGLGVSEIVDIPKDYKLSEKQVFQLEATRSGNPVIDKKKINAYLETFEYPLYFFDYETFSGLIPRFDGLRPYQQVPFQYSLHILDKPGGDLRHEEYLHTSNTNPAEKLSKALKSHIGATGSVITWNMGFEKSCNTLLGSLTPEYKDFYKGLNERIVDLMLPFSKNWYVDKGFKGSASIKSVLPVLVPELSYKALGIQEGSSAQRLWTEAVLDGKQEINKEQVFADLVEYCKMDTLAMVEIYKVLQME